MHSQTPPTPSFNAFLTIDRTDFGDLQLIWEQDGRPSHLVLAQINTDGKPVTCSKRGGGRKYTVKTSEHLFEVAFYETKQPAFDIFVDKEWAVKFTSTDSIPYLMILESNIAGLETMSPELAKACNIRYCIPHTQYISSNPPASKLNHTKTRS